MCSSPGMFRAGVAPADARKTASNALQTSARELASSSTPVSILTPRLSNHLRPRRAVYRLAQDDDSVSGKAARKSAFSKTVTHARLASSPAQESPAGPAPITATVRSVAAG